MLPILREIVCTPSMRDGRVFQSKWMYRVYLSVFKCVHVDSNVNVLSTDVMLVRWNFFLTRHHSIARNEDFFVLVGCDGIKLFVVDAWYCVCASILS